MHPELLVNDIFRRVALGTRMDQSRNSVKRFNENFTHNRLLSRFANREHAQHSNLKNFYFADVTKAKRLGAT